MKTILTAVALTAFPFISFVATNFDDPAFEVARFLRSALPIFGLGIVVSVVIPAILRLCLNVRFAPISLQAAFSWVGLFMFATVQKKLTSLLGFTEQESLVGFVALFVVANALLFFLMRFENIKQATSIFAVVIVVIPLMQITFAVAGGYANSEVEHRTFGSAQLTESSEHAPNIYFIVLDAYGSADALAHYVGLDISDFLQDSRVRGFYVADQARAPYNMTFLVLAAILNMDYPINEDSPAYRNRKSFYPAMLGNDVAPAAVIAFRKIGYDFYIVGNKWGRCRGPHVSCLNLEDQGGLPYETQTFLYATPLVWYEKKFSSRLVEPNPETGVDAIGSTMKHLESVGIPTKPTVFFIHHFPPHPPYLFKEDCSVRETFDFDFEAWDQQSKPLYKENVICTNLRLNALFDWVQNHDGDAIVIATGDHGTHFTNGDDPRERASVLSLARFPDHCSDKLSPSTGSINLMRMAYSCAANHPVRLLPEKTYFGTYDTKGKQAGKVWNVMLP